MDTDQNAPLTKFTVNLAGTSEVEKELTKKIDYLKSRIDNLVGKVEITIGESEYQKMQILGQILGLCQNRKELEVLGKALLRVAPMLEELNDLKKRTSLLQTAKKDPAWFASTFGDFSDDVEKDLDIFLSDGKDQV